MFTTFDNQTGQPVIELEFKFIRYQLVVDSMEKAEELKRLIHELTLPRPKPETEEVRLPKFYARKR